MVPPSKSELMLQKCVKSTHKYTEMSENTENGGKVVIDIGGHIYGFVPPQETAARWILGVMAKHIFQQHPVSYGRAHSGSRVELPVQILCCSVKTMGRFFHSTLLWFTQLYI